MSSKYFADNPYRIYPAPLANGAAMLGGTAKNCIFENCSVESANLGYPYYLPGSSYGGAINKGEAYDCLFTNCSAGTTGGAMQNGTAYNSTFVDCTAENTGGGALNYSDAYNCSFKNCVDKFDSAFYGRKNTAYYCNFEGGGILKANSKFCVIKDDSPVIQGTHIGLLQNGILKVRGADISDSLISETKIKDGAITELKINDSAISKDKIKDGAVTVAKLASDVDEHFVNANDLSGDTMSGPLTAPQVNVDGNWVVGDGHDSKQIISIANSAAGNVVWSSGTTKTVIHNLNIVGDYIVIITPTSDPGGTYYVSAKDSLSFTVTTTETSGFSFDYLIIKN